MKPKLPSPGTAIAVLAIVVAVAGTALAGPSATTSALNKSEKKQTRNLAKQEIAKAASQLSVANAANAGTAANANAVGGRPLSGLLTTNGCQKGKVLGYARIRGESATVFPISSTYTSSSGSVDILENCSGGSVEVRRDGTGNYFIRFNGHPAFLAHVQARFDTTSGTDQNNCATVAKVTAGPDTGSFQVTVIDCATGAAEDGDVTILLI